MALTFETRIRIITGRLNRLLETFYKVPHGISADEKAQIRRIRGTVELINSKIPAHVTEEDLTEIVQACFRKVLDTFKGTEWPMPERFTSALASVRFPKNPNPPRLPRQRYEREEGIPLTDERREAILRSAGFTEDRLNRSGQKRMGGQKPRKPVPDGPMSGGEDPRLSFMTREEIEREDAGLPPTPQKEMAR